MSGETKARKDVTLNEMIDAIREVLGKPPLPRIHTRPRGSGRATHVTLEQRDARRFYVAPFSSRPTMTPRRGSGA